MKTQDQITITKKEYESLLEDSRILRALEAAGVDSWGGYEHAMEILDAE